jgi:polyisoprenyl-phosphate glycosyltransferase
LPPVWLEPSKRRGNEGFASEIHGSLVAVLIAVVIPVYNDWESVGRLLQGLGDVGRANGLALSVILVDDASSTPAPDAFPGLDESVIQRLRVVRLAFNLGHQRAIAVGIVVASEQPAEHEATVVMDGDGEDRPEDLPRLLQSSRENPSAIVCARRARRSESIPFRIFYLLYKVTFGKLTGVRIDFGNFCLIPRKLLRTIAAQPGIWNHLAATLTRSRVPLVKVETDRGARFAGKSTMSFVSLVVHGLSAITVYADVVLVRLLLATAVFAGCAVLGLLGVVGVRLFTNEAIPGWTSNVAGTLVTLLVHAVVSSVIGVFVILSQRTARPILPAVDAKDFVEMIRTVIGKVEARP